MDLDQLRAVVAVLDHGSFARASTALGVPRATLRMRVDRLEHDLGRPLLVRTHRGVQATEEGASFAERARKLVEDAATLFASTRDDRPAQGVLTLSSAPGMPPFAAAALNAALWQRHSDLMLRVHITANPVQSIPADTDVIIHFGPRLQTGDFRTLALLRFALTLVASPTYLDAHGRPTHPAELADHALLGWIPPGGNPGRWPLRDGGELEVRLRFASNDAMLVHTCAAAGQGIALAPDHELGRAAFPGPPLERVLPDVIGSEQALHVLIPEARAHTQRSRAALATIRDLAGGMFEVAIEPE